MKTLFVTGDSTTGLNPPSTETGDKVSWSDAFGAWIATDRISYRNRAAPGRSIRDYHHRGLLAQLLETAAPGDIVLACHGHLEKTPLTRPNDRARGCIPGDGELVVEVYDAFFGRNEIIHTFGWYVREYAKLCRAKQVTPVFLSPPVRNVWENGRIRRTRSTVYAETMKAVGDEIGAIYIDNAKRTEQYLNSIGPEQAAKLYLPDDETHTNAHGAPVFAALIVEQLVQHASGLFAEAFLPSPAIPEADLVESLIEDSRREPRGSTATPAGAAR